MIHTNEPANVFYVYLTAYRGFQSEELNEALLKGMIKRIQKYPGMYGRIESYNIAGCFREEGQLVATQERTLKVMCRKESQVAELTWLACHEYDQDAVLVVNSQTHTATLGSIKQEGEYPMTFPSYHEQGIGVFTKVDKPQGECYSVDDAGNYWECL